MQKKLIALVAAALTVSATSVFAAPAVAGDISLEYQKDKGSDSTLISETNINLDANFAENINLHSRFTAYYDADNDNMTSVELSQLFVNTQVNDLTLNIGKQPLWLGGHGLLADAVGVNGVQIGTTFGDMAFAGFHGKDGDSVTAIDVAGNVGKAVLGASYLKKGDAYLGINAAQAISEDAVGSIEFVKNTDSKADGFLAQIAFGGAKKVGDIGYTVSYRDIEAGAVDAGYTTDSNYNDSKGFRFGVTYKVAKNGVLSAYHDAVDSQAGFDKSRTKVEYIMNF